MDYYCERCNKTMGAENFYTSNNLEKYPPDGKLHQCKKCISSKVDNWDSKTYLWILQEVDVPYVPDEWNSLLASYGKDRSKVTGTTILGRYLSKMKLKQYRDYRWKDTEFLQELSQKKIKEAMERQGYDIQEITETINKGTIPVPDPGDYQQYEQPAETASSSNPYLATGDEDYFASQYGDEDDSITSQLTDEDKTYLRLKWGNTYKPSEWIRLEQLYNEMMNSYDIQSAGHVDTLKMICKTSLKSNSLLDIGDVDGAQKMIKMYDQLMKSGKFTAAQNKAENGEYVDSIGELVAICESDGFIPRFYVEEPNDKVDRTLQDIQSYTKKLIMDDSNLGTMIEKAMKEIAIQKEKEADNAAEAADDDEVLENELFSEQSVQFLTDSDYEELTNLEEEQEEADNQYLMNLLENGDIKE